MCTVFLCNLLGKNKELKVFSVTYDALMFHACSNLEKKNRLSKFKVQCSFIATYLHSFILEAFTCYITCSTIVDKTNVTCSGPEMNFSFIKPLHGENKRWFLFPPFIVLSRQLRVRHWSSKFTIHFIMIVSKPLMVRMWRYYTVGFRYIWVNSLSMEHQTLLKNTLY